MKPRISIEVHKEKNGYSAVANIDDKFIATMGNTFEELKIMVLEAVNLSFEEEEYVYTIDEIEFSYDMQSFFAFYKLINAKALSERIGMNQSLLSQYISGIKKPSAKQANRILQGVNTIGKELLEVRFLL